jgi:voltage-gated potassium channel
MEAPTAAALQTPSDPEPRFGKPPAGWRRSLYHVVFESGNPAGRLFDLVLIAAILLSVGVVVADSMHGTGGRFQPVLEAAEWAVTILFTLEYIARLLCVRHPMRYATSLFGVIDLVALLPTYLAFFFPGLHALIDVRILRLLRIFRILKMGAYIAEYSALGSALAASRRKIFVFLSFVLMVVLVMGTLMYVIEGPANGFTSIPVGMYWAVVTMTTVGFGDITPQTALGRFIASFQMLLGWGILAVPTGIVSAEFTAQQFSRAREPEAGAPRRCPSCGSGGHAAESTYCKDCGAVLGG